MTIGSLEAVGLAHHMGRERYDDVINGSRPDVLATKLGLGQKWVKMGKNVEIFWVEIVQKF